MATQAHISPETLLDFAEGRLPERDAARAQAHLDSCTECAAELAGWRRTVAALSTRLPAPPEHVLQRAFNLVAARPAAPSLLGRLVERLEASLVWNGGLQPGLAGARDLSTALPSAGAPLRARYAAGEYQIDLLAEALGGAWSVSGQLTGGDAATHRWQALLTEEGNERAAATRTVELDHRGQFFLTDLPASRHTLMLRTEDREITLPALDL